VASPVDLLIEREEQAYLRGAVAALPERERRAVVGYYLQDRPMWELAGELGVTASRVSQLCKRGLSLLREALASYLGGGRPEWNRSPNGEREDADAPLQLAG
jgi:RNA polymerase sigma factor for flagellar operon FliA